MAISTETQKEVDLTEIFVNLKEKYRNVFMHQYGDQVFFYRALGRKEYKTLVDEKALNDLQKENVICEVCTLWPENYDWDACDAGIPALLSEAIIKNSFLDNTQSRINLLTYYRQEMYDLDNQITCLIHEAFPQFDIEEIEEWDVEKTTKYLSRAEWILHNLHGLQFVDNGASEVEEQHAEVKGTKPQAATVSPEPEPVKESKDPDEEILSGSGKRNIRGGTREKLTPEKMREMEEFAKKFGINPFEDSVLQGGISGLEGDAVDTTAPALRPGW